MGGRVLMTRGRYAPTADAVFLAAAAADYGANTVLDIGIGTGAATLCLMQHGPNITATGIDISDEMIAECAKNAELNSRDIELISADINTWRTPRTFDLVITNPPYFTGTPAHHGAHHNADIDMWMRRAVARVRPRGHICAIADASMTTRLAAAVAPACGDVDIIPLRGGGTYAERVIIRARAGSRGPTRIFPSIPMDMGAILRDGLTIDKALATLNLL